MRSCDVSQDSGHKEPNISTPAARMAATTAPKAGPQSQQAGEGLRLPSQHDNSFQACSDALPLPRRHDAETHTYRSSQGGFTVPGGLVFMVQSVPAHLEDGVKGGYELCSQQLLAAVIPRLDDDGPQSPAGSPAVGARPPHARPLLRKPADISQALAPDLARWDGLQSPKPYTLDPKGRAGCRGVASALLVRAKLGSVSGWKLPG